MKAQLFLYLLAVGVTAELSLEATKCKLTGSDSVVCRSCASRDCDNMGSLNPGDSYNFNCYCPYGEEVSGSQ
jgi:hypothetical protein